MKELVDNGLDACEQAGIAPEITVSFTGDALAVSDNGPGIPPDVVTRVLDFSTRTSDQAAYVSPTRGAQGNALKTVLAIPYVRNPEQAAVIGIEAQGARHVITVSTDHIARRPRIEHLVEEIVKNEETSIRVRLDSCSSQAQQETPALYNGCSWIIRFSILTPPSPWRRAKRPSALNGPLPLGESGCPAIPPPLIGTTRSGWRT